MFSADDPFTGIDVDNCIDGSTAEVKAWARPILDQLNSYGEISPSGKGVKVFVRASKRGTACKRSYEDGAVEIYDRKRLFTVTGARLMDLPAEIEQRQSALDAVYSLVFDRRKPQDSRPSSLPGANDSAPLGDEAIIERARRARNRDRFAALFDRGDTSAYSGDSSAADLALCAILAFWTRDAAQLDRLFRRSALMRGKWDEKHYGDGRTYGQGTIGRALEQVVETYHPPKRRKGAIPGGTCYRATANGLVWDKQTANGPIPTPLTNFSARIVADVSRDDGVETSHVFTLEAELGGRRHRFDISSSKFNGLNWVTESLGARGIVYPGFGIREHARVAIQMLSDDIVARTVFTHLGWRRVADRYVYLHAGGAIGPDACARRCARNPSSHLLRAHEEPHSLGEEGGFAPIAPEAPEIEVNMGPELARFTLPTPPSEARAVAATAASLRMLELAADEVIIPVFAATWQSVLGPCDFSLHLSGASGTFKTELAAMCQQHFGPELDARNLLGSWSSTANSLEALAFIAKDALLVVDDFAPSGTPNDVARLHREAARLIRAQGNRSGRGRLRADSTPRPTRCPRGLILSTGEDSPGGHSIRARIGIVEIDNGAISQTVLTGCQRDAREGLYAEAMAAFLSWLAPRYGEIRLSQETAELRERACSEPGTHRRTPAMVASLFLGIQYFTRFARDIGVFDETQAETFQSRSWDALGVFAAAQATHLQSADPAERFCALLASALASGRAHVADPHGQVPQWDGSNDESTPASWGWRRVCMGSGNYARDEWRPQGDRVGWYDATGGDLYLDIESSLRVAQAAAPSGTDGVTVSARTLVRRLKEKGCLRSTDTGRDKNTVQRQLQGQRRNVVHLEVWALTSGVRALRAQWAHTSDCSFENGVFAPESSARNVVDQGFRAHVRAQSPSQEAGSADWPLDDYDGRERECNEGRHTCRSK